MFHWGPRLKITLTEQERRKAQWMCTPSPWWGGYPLLSISLVSGAIQSSLIQSWQQLCKAGVSTPKLSVKKTSVREVRGPLQGHQLMNWGQNLDVPASPSCSLTHLLWQVKTTSKFPSNVSKSMSASSHSGGRRKSKESQERQLSCW